MKIVQECGQKWYRWSSWKHSYNFKMFRKLAHNGFAIGPIMFFFDPKPAKIKNETKIPDRQFGGYDRSHRLSLVNPPDPELYECLACNSCTCHSERDLKRPCTDVWPFPTN